MQVIERDGHVFVREIISGRIFGKWRTALYWPLALSVEMFLSTYGTLPSRVYSAKDEIDFIWVQNNKQIILHVLGGGTTPPTWIEEIQETSSPTGE